MHSAGKRTFATSPPGSSTIKHDKSHCLHSVKQIWRNHAPKQHAKAANENMDLRGSQGLSDQ